MASVEAEETRGDGPQTPQRQSTTDRLNVLGIGVSALNLATDTIEGCIRADPR
jgi:hypothetical protein